MNNRRPRRLHDFLAEVPDPRERSGRRHPLAAILAHACCAILCGCRGYAAIAQWGRDQPIGLMHRLGYTRRPPSYGAIREVFLRLDADAFEAAVARWVDHLLRATEPSDADADGVPLQAVAIDGKMARGSRHGDVPAVHLLAALDRATGCTLSQARVPATTNEHKTALKLLEDLALEGRVLTGDAASCQRDLSRSIVAAGGHFLWKIDANQPTMLADVEAACEPPVSPLRPEAVGHRTRGGDDRQQARRPDRTPPAGRHGEARRLSRLAARRPGRPLGADDHGRR